MGRRGRTVALAPILLGALLALLPAPTSAQRVGPDDVDLADVIAVQLVDRDLVALGGGGSGTLTVRLELGEKVLWTGAKGRVALVQTDRRMLAATPNAASWREARFRRKEGVMLGPFVAQRVALVVTRERALGFDARSNNWIELGLGPHERVLLSRVGPSTAVVVTSRRAAAVSPDSGGFFEIELYLEEDLESVIAGPGLATITTSKRILVFRGSSGTWAERKRPLN